MKQVVIIGDSYSAAREADTGLDRGWPSQLNLHSLAVSGSTAAQWASDLNGWLTKAKAAVGDVLIASLLGNDAFGLVGQGIPSLPIIMAEAGKIDDDLFQVFSAMKRATNYVLLYPDAFAGRNQEYNIGLPILNSTLASVATRAIPAVQLVDLGKILGPSDFNGSDIHPTVAGHAKIAAYFAPLLNS